MVRPTYGEVVLHDDVHKIPKTISEIGKLEGANGYCGEKNNNNHTPESISLTFKSAVKIIRS